MHRLGDATWRFWLTVSALFLAGLLLVVLGGLYVHAEWREIVFAIGAAPMVAAFLAVSVDQWLKHRLVEDAFRAAINYVLPKALRREMDWFYSLKVICAELIEEIRLEEVGGDLVVAHLRLDRLFRNETEERQTLHHDLAIDEWHHDGHESRITAVGPVGEQPVIARKPYAVVGQAPRPTTLGPGESVRMWDEGSEVKRRSDSLIFFVRHATSNIRVDVAAPADLEVYVDVATRDPERISAMGRRVYRFDGTLLPYQAIRVRWFPADVSN